MGTSERSNKPVREPVRIKVYKLIYMTRRGYLLLLSIGLVLALGLIVIRLWGYPLIVSDKSSGSKLVWEPLPHEPVEMREITTYDRLAYGLLGNLHWIVLGALVLGGIEAFFVLRRFSREELLQRALLDDQPASESEKHGTP